MRTYGGQTFDLRAVDVPNWKLMRTLERLLSPYYEAGPLNRLSFSAEDDRGTIQEPSVEELRGALDEEGRWPTRLIVQLVTREDELFKDAWISMAAETGSMAQVASTSEEFVNHIRARLHDIFAEASLEEAKRRTQEAIQKSPSIGPHVPVPATPAQPWYYNPWVIALGSGLILALLGVVLTVAFT